MLPSGTCLLTLTWVLCYFLRSQDLRISEPAWIPFCVSKYLSVISTVVCLSPPASLHISGGMKFFIRWIYLRNFYGHDPPSSNKLWHTHVPAVKADAGTFFLAAKCSSCSSHAAVMQQILQRTGFRPTSRTPVKSEPNSSHVTIVNYLTRLTRSLGTNDGQSLTTSAMSDPDF